MKQLVYTFPSGDERIESSSYFIVALDDRALVGTTTEESPSSTPLLLELEAPVSAASGTNDETTELAGDAATKSDNAAECEDAAAKNEDDDNAIPLQQIQAVAGCRDGDVLYFAVARHSKQLYIYRVALTQLQPKDDADDDVNKQSTGLVVPPLTLHQTPKRVSSMIFGKIPGTSSSSSSLTVLITGDLAGDAFAYSLTQASTEITAKEAANEGQLPHRRLLLGHTASMLTSVTLCTFPNSDNGDEGNNNMQFILTADRDEKIRVTRFPSTFEIHGFLFGHTAFVSCMAVAGTRCYSCGGDSTLKVWNIPACRQEASLDLQKDLVAFQVASGVPCEMCAGYYDNSSSNRSASQQQQHVVAVIYDRSPHLDIFTIETSDDTTTKETRITERHQLILPGQPIGLASMGSKFLVLVQEPHFLQCYDWNGQSCALPAALQRAQELGSTSCGIKLPTAILERDAYDHLKMSKNVETRGPASLMPWNNAERKQVAVEKRSRKRRRKTKGSSSNNTQGGDDGGDNAEENAQSAKSKEGDDDEGKD